jgi:Mrp family chromosome partitioning ATPase
MKKLTLGIAMILASMAAEAYASTTVTQIYKCDMSIVSTAGDQIKSVSQRITGAIVSDSESRFYVVVRTKFYLSPTLFEHNGKHAAQDKTGVTYLKSDGMYSVSTAETSYIFDQCTVIK